MKEKMKGESDVGIYHCIESCVDCSISKFVAQHFERLLSDIPLIASLVVLACKIGLL